MKEYVTWKQVEGFVDKVSEIFGSRNLKGVYGLPRGGLVLAVMLSHKMKIPMLMAPCKDCLVVDDICDTGESLIHYVNNTINEGKGFLTATMYYKPNKLGIRPTWYQFEKKDSWIIFPWEEKEE